MRFEALSVQARLCMNKALGMLSLLFEPNTHLFNCSQEVKETTVKARTNLYYMQSHVPYFSRIKKHNWRIFQPWS